MPRLQAMPVRPRPRRLRISHLVAAGRHRGCLSAITTVVCLRQPLLSRVWCLESVASRVALSPKTRYKPLVGVVNPRCPSCPTQDGLAVQQPTRSFSLDSSSTKRTSLAIRCCAVYWQPNPKPVVRGGPKGPAGELVLEHLQTPTGAPPMLVRIDPYIFWKHRQQ